MALQRAGDPQSSGAAAGDQYVDALQIPIPGGNSDGAESPAEPPPANEHWEVDVSKMNKRDMANMIHNQFHQLDEF
jgi:hypothetical protein